MITGIELALAVLPLLISATEHHKKALRQVKVILSTKRKIEQQLVFYNELYEELALLANTLKAVIGDLSPRSETQNVSLTQDEHDQIENTLGTRTAESFSELLGRLLSSLNDLVSEKTLGLNKSDMFSVICPHLDLLF